MKTLSRRAALPGTGLLALALGLSPALAKARHSQHERPRRHMMSLTIKSPAFQQGRPIPKKFTCDGPDVSPALEWAGAPEKTQSFALIMDDPDAPPGTWVHWVAYAIPAAAKSLPENFPKSPSAPDGTMQGLCWGVKEFDRVGYHGPCPPPGKPHRYFFKLYALDFTPQASPRKNKFELLSLIKGHVLAEAELMGTYQK